jgi:hypothetical protein
VEAVGDQTRCPRRSMTFALPLSMLSIAAWSIRRK